MDQVHEPRRYGLGIAVAVVVAVCASLLLRPLTEMYKIKNHNPDSDLVKTLRAIPPPAGAKLVKIEGMATSPRLPPTVAVGFYTAHAAVDTVESYYKQEFPRHGFVYQPRANPVSDTPPLFCAPSYMAVLSLGTPDGDVLAYRIFLQRRDEPC